MKQHTFKSAVIAIWIMAVMLVAVGASHLTANASSTSQVRGMTIHPLCMGTNVPPCDG